MKLNFIFKNIAFWKRTCQRDKKSLYLSKISSHLEIGSLDEIDGSDTSTGKNIIDPKDNFIG